MWILIVGLVLFLGVHSLRIVADDWRKRTIARIGEGPWKGLVSLLSIVGFVVLVWGFGLARQQPVLLWIPPLWLRHLNALFTLVAFILVAAAYVPRNHIRPALGHPMYAGVKVWAFGHLLATGMLRDEILFGAFLVWSIAGFTAGRRRNRREGVTFPPGTVLGDALTALIGAGLWALFAFWLHAKWIGVAPFG